MVPGSRVLVAEAVSMGAVQLGLQGAGRSAERPT